MKETAQDLAELHRLLDRTLDADRLVRDLTGVHVLNIATTTARGEPRLTAVDGHFGNGRWYFSTAGNAVKADACAPGRR